MYMLNSMLDILNIYMWSVPMDFLNNGNDGHNFLGELCMEADTLH